MPTDIEWTTGPDGEPGESWNPVTGCSKVSEGCRFCYAEALALRFGRSAFPWTAPHATEVVTLHPERVTKPWHWRKPRIVFVNSMSDLFHEQVPDPFISEVFAAMLNPRALHHTFIILTKRPERMVTLLTSDWWTTREVSTIRHIWLGVSAEDQKAADQRIPLLLDTHAALRLVSCEPLLGSINLSPYLAAGLDWVIAGGESGGPPRRALVSATNRVTRQYEPTPDGLVWARSLRDQCRESNTPFFWKQWGGPRHYFGGALLDNRYWHERPDLGRIPEPPTPSQASLL